MADKACIKEGGKKGQDLSGVAALGGVCYFNVAVEEPNGDLALVKKVMEGANALVDEAAEERKGGAGDIAKFFLSAGAEQLVGYCHVPKALAESKGLTIQEWVEELNSVIKGEVAFEGEEFATVVAKADPENGRFPLKLRDEAINKGFALLRAKGLVPADDSDSDDVNYAEAAGVEW